MVSVFAEKIFLCKGYLQTGTEVYMNTYRGYITGRMWWCSSGQNKNVGTLTKKRQIETSYAGNVPDVSKFTETHHNLHHFSFN